MQCIKQKNWKLLHLTKYTGIVHSIVAIYTPYYYSEKNILLLSGKNKSFDFFYTC